VLIAQHHLVASRADCLPSHRPQIQVVKFVSVDVVLVDIEMTASARNIASEEIHVVLVDARGVIGDPAWHTLCVTCRLDQTPLVVALDGVACGRGELLRVDLGKALHVEFVE